MIISGIDQQTKKFTEPPDHIKKEIASIKANKSIPEAQKREDLAQLEVALKEAKPIRFKENIAIVLTYFDQLLGVSELGL
jgi:septal ring factor EnvC (AmiA/AmiB activator)